MENTLYQNLTQTATDYTVFHFPLFFSCMSNASVNRIQNSEFCAMSIASLCVYRSNSVSVLIVFRFESLKSLEYYIQHKQPSPTNQIHCRIQSTWFPSLPHSFVFASHILFVFLFFLYFRLHFISTRSTCCASKSQRENKRQKSNEFKNKDDAIEMVEDRNRDKGSRKKPNGTQNTKWCKKELLQQNECILLVFPSFYFILS